ncbi:hypothetical protein EXN66_Car011711 [Channa argus]|uniref:Uncharacterized protein n=1 Tax=Channa argus TaxID=215402 RepID=A0A6G1Q0I8_CHAAH|nr:hypothetical protein EXN66_Car011711 [Channa argus]
MKRKKKDSITAATVTKLLLCGVASVEKIDAIRTDLGLEQESVIVPVFLTHSLLSHVNTVQVVHSTALRPCNVFRARLAGWLACSDIHQMDCSLNISSWQQPELSPEIHPSDRDHQHQQQIFSLDHVHSEAHARQ